MSQIPASKPEELEPPSRLVRTTLWFEQAGRKSFRAANGVPECHFKGASGAGYAERCLCGEIPVVDPRELEH